MNELLAPSRHNPEYLDFEVALKSEDVTSWLMKCLAAHIARQANTADGCKGRSWEGRLYIATIV